MAGQIPVWYTRGQERMMLKQQKLQGWVASKILQTPAQQSRHTKHSMP